MTKTATVTPTAKTTVVLTPPAVRKHHHACEHIVHVIVVPQLHQNMGFVLSVIVWVPEGIAQGFP